MAITQAQTPVIGAVVSGNTLAATFGSNTTTGNTIVVIANGFNAGAAITVSSIAISAGAATFTKQIAQVGTTTYPSAEGWAAASITGGTTPKITVTFSGAPQFGDVTIYELAGMPTTLTADGTASGKAGTAATACTAPAITTTNAGSIIFASFGPSQSMNAGEATWTISIGSTGATADDLSECKIQTTTQTALVPTATQSASGTYSAITFALQPAGGGSFSFSGTGAVNVTGVTNLPAAIPQMTGTVLVTGATNLPAAIPQLSGNVAVTGLLNVSLGPQMAGSILVTGITNLPAAIPQLTGSILVTGATNLPAAIPQLTGAWGVTGAAPAFGLGVSLTGNILVTGTTSLGGLSLTGNWGVTGILNPSLATFLSGSILATGQVSTGIAATLPGGAIHVTGLFNPALGLGLAGTILETGILTPSFNTPFYFFSGTGAIGVSGLIIPTYQSPTQPVTVPVTGIYITLTVDNSYWITLLFAGVDYSTWIKTVMSGPYAAIGRMMAYDVAVQALYAQIGSGM